MSFLILIFFINLLTSKLLAESNLNLTSQQPNDPHCKINHDELLSIGPCQKNLIYCQNGIPLHLNCPESMIFNPSTKFCEKPEDFLKEAATSTNNLLLPPNDILMPYVGKMEPEIEHSYYSNHSMPLLVPLNNIQPPFVGKMEPETDHSYYPVLMPPNDIRSHFVGQMEPETNDSIYSVLLPSNDIQPPFIGKTEPEIDKDDSSYSVLMPSNDIRQPFVGQLEPETDDSSYSVLMPSNDVRQPFIGKMEPETDDSSYSVLLPSNRAQPSFTGDHHSVPEQSYTATIDKPKQEQFEPREPMDDSEQILATSMGKHQPRQSEYREPMDDSEQIHATSMHKHQPEQIKSQKTALDDSEQIYDAFMAKKQPSEQSGSQEPLFDHFKSSDNQLHSSKTSPFAAFDHSADSGHDSFKPKIYHQTVKSRFAPMDTPVEFGHDMFKTRRKRLINGNSANFLSAGIDTNNMDVCLQLYANQLASRAITGYFMNQSSQCIVDQIPNGCRQFYNACLNGRLIRRHCPVELFFDPVMKICKKRSQIAECLVHQTPKELIQSALLQNQQQQKPTTQAPHEQSKTINVNEQLKTINTNATSINTSPVTVNTAAATPANNDYVLPTSVPSPLIHRRLQSKKEVIKQKPQMPVLYPYDNFPDKFCLELPDGFYRHPKNCSRIVQCFGHELIEYPSCQHDLAFNQLTGVCDYPANIPGCSHLDGNDQFDFIIPETEISLQNDIDEQQEIPSTSTSNSTFQQSTSSPLDSIGACAGGHSHGDHIEHPDHCSAFLRCVWGKLVPMSCPKGTAFNPMLSVCDYPNRVPNCQIQ